MFIFKKSRKRVHHCIQQAEAPVAEDPCVLQHGRRGQKLYRSLVGCWDFCGSLQCMHQGIRAEGYPGKIPKRSIFWWNSCSCDRCSLKKPTSFFVQLCFLVFFHIRLFFGDSNSCFLLWWAFFLTSCSLR